ncbi:MAG: deoxyguanosinetriphosphate triphosphohydrolase, partial [candidate division Zixibacteria bacterium]|nr:deoxyguanosinetriphosphate triphosphohydrolase [candidate division Zixibacteria bacterium]
MADRKEIENRERQTLAPYAALSAESRGRVYPQEEHELRTAYQRDRDRIIHSAAFRRMEYKTQVFIPHERDHFRTRLTHTAEVAQISRSMARNLRLNEDLAEAIALVHDLGHTPFGHAGEDALDELLKDHGGFNHNRQSLRVVDKLERRYFEHPGLNLTYEVREGIVKHETKIKIELPEFKSDEQPTLEAALVDIADELAYNAHDLDDGLSSGLISFDEVMSIGADQIIEVTSLGGKTDFDKNRYAIIRNLINKTVLDVLDETGKRITEQNIKDLKSVRNCKSKLCDYSGDMKESVVKVKEFLFTRLYKHPKLLKHSARAAQIVNKIFDHYLQMPEKLPEDFREMLAKEKKE